MSDHHPVVIGPEAQWEARQWANPGEERPTDDLARRKQLDQRARKAIAAERMAEAIERFLDHDVSVEDYWKGPTLRQTLADYRALVPRSSSEN